MFVNVTIEFLCAVPNRDCYVFGNIALMPDDAAMFSYVIDVPPD